MKNGKRRAKVREVHGLAGDVLEKVDGYAVIRMRS